MALVEERADLRGKAIKRNSIIYDFHVTLEKGDHFSGYAEITFDLHHVPEELVLDFKGSKISKLVQNGKTIEAKVVEGFILL